MTLLKKYLSILLAVVLCLGLTACGGSDDTVDETVGDDWRSSGDVVASGTITHENEGSVNVLVTVDENSAAFYRDEPEQVLFDSVSFPITVPDAQEAFDGISFDDIDGDGETDVSVGFVYAPGDSISMVWIWDPEERYVFREDLSVLTTNSGDISDYVGLWEYVDEGVWITIYEDETWECFDDQGVFQSGTLSVDSTGVTFYLDDSDEELHFDRTASGDLIHSESDSMLVPAYDIQTEDSNQTAYSIPDNFDSPMNSKVVGGGTITHTGVGSMDVLIAVNEAGIEICDESNHTLYANAFFPITIIDVREAYSDIVLEDINGDGESDVRANFVHVSGESSWLVWIWDSELEQYVFQDDLSELPTDDGDIGYYTGLWKFVGKNLWLKIYDDETCEFVNDQEDIIDYGDAWVNATGITLRFYDGSDILMLYRAENGDLIGTNGDVEFVPVDSIQ